jgi:SAM-dependent methyltransferase
VNVALLDGPLVGRFIALRADGATAEFLDRELARRHGRARWALHRLLLGFRSDFDVNGVLGTYALHLLSAEQWEQLLGPPQGGRLLDVGAGAGEVTRALAARFDEVIAVETSKPLLRRLRRAGVRAERADLTRDPVPEAPYDAIALLNVLDRCARPRTLLARACGALRPGGVLLVSVPLPYRPLHYRGGRVLDPDEPLRIGDGPWERQLGALVRDVIVPCGLEVEAWTRAPYLSGGDRHEPCYVLDAAVVVCHVGAVGARGIIGPSRR